MNDYPVPPNFQGLLRNMQKSIDRLERRPTTSHNAVVSGGGDAQMVTDGSGTPLPTTAPAASPPVKAFGNSVGITLVVDDPDVAQTTYLDYYIDGVLFAHTQSRVVQATEDASGLPLTDDTVYTFYVVASNVAGSADPSPSVTASLDPTVNQTTVLGWVVAGFILAGSIQVGNITIDPDSGITIPLASGGVIQFPADGSDAVIQAVLRTADLIVNGGLTINGTTNKVNGSLKFSSIVEAPNSLPVITQDSYPTVALSGGGGLVNGAVLIPSSNNVLTLTNINGALVSYNRSTGAPNGSSGIDPPPPIVTGYSGTFTGLSYVSGRYYSLSIRHSGTGVSTLDLVPFDWDNSTSSVTTQYSPVRLLSNSAAVETGPVNLLGDDGGTGVYVQVGATVTRYTATTGASVSSVTLAGYSKATHGTMAYAGSAGYGAVVYQSQKGFSWNSSGTRTTTYDFPLPSGVSYATMLWDGANRTLLGSLGSTRQLNTLSSLLTGVFDFAVSYYDADSSAPSNTGGTPTGGTPGTHETQVGATVAYSASGGTWVKVALPPPNDQGGVDDPNSTRLYVAATHGGTLYKQPDLAPGVVSATYGSFVTGTKVPETVNGFAAIGSTSVAYSGALNLASAAVWSLSGAGPGNVGPAAWNATGKALIGIGAGGTLSSTSGTANAVIGPVAVPFPSNRFASAPAVTASADNSAVVTVWAQGATATGFNLYFKASVTGTYNFSWIAMPVG